MAQNPGPFSVDIKVKLKDVENAVFSGVGSSRELRRVFNRFMEDVEETWKLVWDSSMEGVMAKETGHPHPYQTGEYRSHIKRDKLSLRQRLFIKSTLRKGIPIGLVYNDDPKAHWIEYGTDPDNPSSESPFGPDTPTPAFEPMTRAARIMNNDVRIR